MHSGGQMSELKLLPIVNLPHEVSYLLFSISFLQHYTDLSF